MFVLVTFLWLLFSSSASAPCTERNEPKPISAGEYDFIIAGAGCVQFLVYLLSFIHVVIGTAGAIVAARLASANVST